MTGTAWSNLSSGGRSWWRTSRPEGKPMGRCTTHLPSPTTWVASWSSRRGGRQTTGARGVCGSALKLPPRWAGLFSDKWCAEPRSEPDSGNPTVRDRRAALRTVTSHASGVLVRALNFEPDNRTHGSTGGGWKRNTLRHRASPRPNHPRGAGRHHPNPQTMAPATEAFGKAGVAHLGIKTEVGTGPAGPRTRTCGRLPVRSADRALARTARVVCSGTGCGAGSALTVTTIENAYCATHAFAAALTATIERRTIPISDESMTSRRIRPHGAHNDTRRAHDHTRRPARSRCSSTDSLRIRSGARASGRAPADRRHRGTKPATVDS